MAYDAKWDFLVKCTDEGTVLFFVQKGLSRRFEYPIPDSCSYTSVLISNKHQCILFGTNLGSVRVYLWPITDYKKQLEYIDFPIHQGAVTNMRLTYD